MAISLERRKGRKRKKRVKRLDAASLLKVFPVELLSAIGSQTDVDKNVSRLRGSLILQLLLLNMLRGSDLSTHLLAEFYNSDFFKTVSGKGDHQTAHSSIASRLNTIKPEYFEQVFNWLYKKYAVLLEKSQLGRRIKRFDSTMVSVSSALFDMGMVVGRKPKQAHRKHQLKFTLELHGRLPKSIKLFTEQKHLSEQTALRQAIKSAELQAEDIIVFDSGLSDRQTFVGFDEEDIHFVSRLKSNYRAESIETHRQIQGRTSDGLSFVRDERVRLYATGNQLIEHDFRLIEVVVLDGKNKGKTLVFITNIWDLSAMQIARIYRKRWDIEVFFRFLKQNLSFTKLINRSQNGIQVQMYAAMIAAILLLVYQDRNQIKGHQVAKLRLLDELIVDFAERISRFHHTKRPDG
ncbi:MAG: IS4 family transposase [Bacteroidota bacterium]